MEASQRVAKLSWGMESQVFGVRQSWVGGQALSWRRGCVALGKLFNFSSHRFISRVEMVTLLTFARRSG